MAETESGQTGTQISAVWALGLGFQELTDEKNPAHSDFSPSHLPPTQMKHEPAGTSSAQAESRAGFISSSHREPHQAPLPSIPKLGRHLIPFNDKFGFNTCTVPVPVCALG